MTNLGFYCLYGNKYKLVKMIEVPWDFKLNAPDGILPQHDKPQIGEWIYDKVAPGYIFTTDNITETNENSIILHGEMIVDNSMEVNPENNIYAAYTLSHKDTNRDLFQWLKATIGEYEWEKLLSDIWMRKFILNDISDGDIVYISEEGYRKFRVRMFPILSQYVKPEDIVIEPVKLAYVDAGSMPDSGIMPLDDESIEIPPVEEETPEEKPTEVPIIPLNPLPTHDNFPDWITRYFYETLIPTKGFTDIFNSYVTYIIIPQEKPMDMGTFKVTKGYTEVNFKEHDYRTLIFTTFPEITEAMVKPDADFGGYDEDKDFNQNKTSTDWMFSGYDVGNSDDSSEEGIMPLT